MEVKEEQPKARPKRPKQPVSLVRLNSETKRRMYKEIERINREKEFGRALTADDYLSFAIGLVTRDHTSQLKDLCMTPSDRIDEEFRKFQKARPGASREDFNNDLLRSWQTRLSEQARIDSTISPRKEV